MTININDLLEEWQERLGLQDWAIILRFNLPEFKKEITTLLFLMILKEY